MSTWHVHPVGCGVPCSLCFEVAVSRARGPLFSNLLGYGDWCWIAARATFAQETSEADVREYFMRFGYVMDVYMPKAKDNKTEHRGFGFVTFETEAAIQRVVSHGAHRLKGSTIAIDIAVPKVRGLVLTEQRVLSSTHFHTWK